MKKLLSFLLVMVMVLSMVPVFASAETVAETPQITYVSMTLNGILDVHFKVSPNGADMSKASIVITGAAAQTIDTYTRDGDLYVYTAKVPAHKLLETMTAELMYNGASVQTKSWNAGTDYLAKLTGSDELNALTTSLQSYGTYAAAYAAGEATDAIDGITAKELIDYKPVIGTNNTALGVVAALYLDDAADLLVKFNSAAWLDTYQLKINGEDATVTDNGEGKMIYRKENLLPQEWSIKYDIQVVDGDSVVYQVSYGVNSYVYQALSRGTEAATGLNNLLKSMYAYSTAAVAYQPAAKTPISLPAIYIRDPFILNNGDAYYLYGTTEQGRFRVWSSTDLNSWYAEGVCYDTAAADGYFDDSASEAVTWAPEVFKYDAGDGEKYYMFATFTLTGNYQATAILCADSPVGPFTPYYESSGYVLDGTARENCSTLDGTLFIANGTPYMIYCHEHQCSCNNGNGTMEYIQLSTDLKATVGSPVELFDAQSAFSGSNGVTDGPFVYTKNGTNYLLWATYTNSQYVELSTTLTVGDSGLSTGDHSVLYDQNGGHGMIFTDMNGTDKLVLHTPNTEPNCRAAMYDFVIQNSTLSIPATPDLLPVKSNAAYDKYKGIHTVTANPGYAVTESTYTAAELTVDLTTDGWPMDGFAIKQGDNIVHFIFGTNGGDTENHNYEHILTYVNGTYQGYKAVPTASAFNLAKESQYELKLIYGNGIANIYNKSGDSWVQINKDPISLATLIGEGFAASQGVQLGIAGQGSKCSFTNVAVNELTAYDEILTVKSNATFDMFTGNYKVTANPGYAVTESTYTAAELTVDLTTDGWPMDGFAIKQGDNIVHFIFGTNGGDTASYNYEHILTYVNGTYQGYKAVPTASAFNLAKNSQYNLKLVYENGYANIYNKSGDSWVQINKDIISLATLFGDSFDATMGVQLGIAGQGSSCSFSDVAVSTISASPPRSITVTLYETGDQLSYGFTWNSETRPAGAKIAIKKTSDAEYTYYSATVADETTYVTADSAVKLYVCKAVVPLEPGVQYSYKVMNAEVDAESAVYTFTAANPNATSFSFASYSDTQNAEENGALWGDVLAKTSDVDFYIHTGDICENSMLEGNWMNMLNSNSQYLATTPIMVVAGNHDTTYQSGVDVINKHFNNNIPDQTTTATGYFYSYSYGNVKFIVLNTNKLEDGKLPAEQYDWLISELQNKTEKWTIVTMHGPMYSVGKWGSDSSLNSTALALRAQLSDVFAQYGVDLVIAGHDHTVSKTYPIGTNSTVKLAQQTISGITYDVNPEGTIYMMAGTAGNQSRSPVSGVETQYYDSYQTGEGQSWAEYTVYEDRIVVTVKCLVGDSVYEYGTWGIMKSDAIQTVEYTQTIKIDGVADNVTTLSAFVGDTVTLPEIYAFNGEIYVLDSSAQGNVTSVKVTEAGSALVGTYIRATLSVTDGASYDAGSGIYHIAAGTALTAGTYQAVELSGDFYQSDWPVQGFVVKQGENVVTFRFATECAAWYGAEQVKVFVNGTQAEYRTVQTVNNDFALWGGTTYTLKLTCIDGSINLYNKSGDSWVKINANDISLASLLGDLYDKAQGVQVGIIGYDGCGGIASNVAVGELSTEKTIITSLAELNNQSGTFVLQSDITGNTTTVTGFTGTLDGNGKTIETSVPLFDELKSNATVEDLNIVLTTDLTAAGVLASAAGNATVTNVQVSGDGTLTAAEGSAVGGLVGNAYSSTFTNCSNALDIIGADGRAVGGIVGEQTAWYSLTIIDCTNTGNLSATGTTVTVDDTTYRATAGGILGYAMQEGAVLKGCINEGNISGYDAGGIVGYAAGGYTPVKTGVTIASSDARATSNSGEITATDIAGGIIGVIGGTYKLSVTGATNTGTVTGTNYAAGVLGYGSYVTVSTIDSCTNDASIYGNAAALVYTKGSSATVTLTDNTEDGVAWYHQGLNGNTGADNGTVNYRVSSTYIPVGVGTTITVNSGYTIGIFAYDANYTYLGVIDGSANVSGNYTAGYTFGNSITYGLTASVGGSGYPAYVRLVLAPSTDGTTAGLTEIPCTAGAEVSVATAVKNDTIWYYQGLDGNTGTDNGAFTYRVTSSFIPVEVGTSIAIDTTYTIGIFAYDADYNYLGVIDGNGDASGNYTASYTFGDTITYGLTASAGGSGYPAYVRLVLAKSSNTDGTAANTDAISTTAGDLLVVTYSEGGTSITSLAELNNQSGTFVLQSDITDNQTTVTGFAGTLIGNGHTIETSVSLFDTLSGATIQDLDIVLTQDLTAAGVLAASAAGNVAVTDVSVSGSGALTGDGVAVGGFVGTVSGTGNVFTDCTNGIAVSGTSHIGGIVGHATSGSSLVLAGCQNNGAISHASGTVGIGGLVGIVDGATVEIKSSETRASANTATVTDTGNSYTGGIVGAVQGSSTLTITGVTNSGNCTGGYSAAGILGYSAAGTTTITDCTNSGTVTSSRLGAICGRIKGTLYYSNCTDTNGTTLFGSGTVTELS